MAFHGFGTSLLLKVAGECWRVPGQYVMTKLFSPGDLSSGVKFPACKKGSKIEIFVRFYESCVFDAALFGKKVAVPGDEKSVEFNAVEVSRGTFDVEKEKRP